LLEASAAIGESNNQTVPPGSLQEQNETPRDLIMIAGGTPALTSPKKKVTAIFIN
jgi:hypothetical protein